MFAASTDCSRSVASRYLNTVSTSRRQNSRNAELRRAIIPTASYLTRFLSKPSRPASKSETEICFNQTSFACCSVLDSALDALHKHNWRRISSCTTSDCFYGSRKSKTQTCSDCGASIRKADCIWSKSAGYSGKRGSQEVCHSDKKDLQSTVSNRNVLADEVSRAGSSKMRSAPLSEAFVSNSPYTPLVRYIHIGSTQRILLTTHSLAGEKDLGRSAQRGAVLRPEKLSTGVGRTDADDSLRMIGSDPSVDDATSDLLCGDVSQIVNKYALAKGASGSMRATQPGREPYHSRSTNGHRCLLKYKLEKERYCSSQHRHIFNKKRDKYAPREAYDKEGDTKYSDRLKKTVKSSISENTQTRRTHGQASEKMNLVTSAKTSSILNDKLPERKIVAHKHNRFLDVQTESMTCSEMQSHARNYKLVRPTDQPGKEKMVLETAKQDQQLGKAKPLERKGSNSAARRGINRVNQRHMIGASEKTDPTGGRFHLAVDELDLQIAQRKQGCILTPNTRRSDAACGSQAIPHRLSKTSKSLPQIPDTAAEHAQNKYSSYWKSKSRCGKGDRGHDSLKETVDDALKYLTKEKQQELVHLITDCTSYVHNAVDFQKCCFGRIEQKRSEWRGPYRRKSFVEKFQPYKVPRRCHSHVSRNGEPEFNNMGALTDVTGSDCVELACVKDLKPSGEVGAYCSLEQTTEAYLKGDEHFDPGTSCKTCDTVAFLDLFLHFPAFFHHQNHPAGKASNTKTFQKFLSSSPLAAARKCVKDIQQGTSMSNKESGKSRKMISGKEIMRPVSGVLGSPCKYAAKSNTTEMKVDNSNIRDYLSHKGSHKKDLNTHVHQEFDEKANVCKKSLQSIQAFTCYTSPERRCVKAAGEYYSAHTKSVHYKTSLGSSVGSTPYQVVSQPEQQRSCKFHTNDMGNISRPSHKRGDRAGSPTSKSQPVATTARKTGGDKWTHRSRIPLPVHFRHKWNSHKLNTEEHRRGSPMDYLLPDNHGQRCSDKDEERLSRRSPQTLSPLQKVGDAEAAAEMGKVKKKMKYQVFTTGLAKAESQKGEEQKTKDGLSKGRLEHQEAIADSNLKMYDGKNQKHSKHREGEAWRTDGQMDNSIFRYRLSEPTFTNKASHGHPARNKQALDRFNSRRGHSKAAYGLRRSPYRDSRDSSPIRLPSKRKSLLSAIQETGSLRKEDDTRAEIESEIQDRKETNAISEMEICADATWLPSASDEALLVSLDELDKRLEDIHTQISGTTSRTPVKEVVELKLVGQEPGSKMRGRVPRGVRSDLARGTLKSTSHSETQNVSKSAEESRMRVKESRMRVEDSRMRVEDSRTRALKAADLRVSKTGAGGLEIAQTLPVTEKQKITGNSRRTLPPSFTKRSMSDHRAKVPGPGIRKFYHICEEITPTDRRLGSRRVESKSSDQSFKEDKDATLSTPLAKMVMAALDRHSRCLSADVWKHTVELRQSMKYPRSLWKSKRHEEAGKKLLRSSSLARYPYKFTKTRSPSEKLDGATTAQETQQRPEGTLPKEVRQTSSMNDSGGEYKSTMSTANVRDTVEQPNAGEKRLVNASDGQDVRATSLRQKSASKLPRFAGHSKTHIHKQLYEQYRSETTKELDAKGELNCENSTIKAKGSDTYEKLSFENSKMKAKGSNTCENLNVENSTVDVMRHADAAASGSQKDANRKTPTSNTEWFVSSHKHRKLHSDDLMGPVNQAKDIPSKPDPQQSSRLEQASEKRHSTKRPLSRARIGEDKPRPTPETPRSPVQPPASRSGNKTVCHKSHRKDTIQPLNPSENPSCKKQKSICSNSSVNGAGSTSRTEQVRSLTDQFTEVECPDEKQCRRTKLVRTVPEDALVSFWTRKPCTAVCDRPKKKPTTGTKCGKDGDAKEKRHDAQQVSLPSYSIRGMGQFVVPGNLSVIKCEPREQHNPQRRLQGLYGEHQGSNGIQRSAENTVANAQVDQANGAPDPGQRGANLQDRGTADTVHNNAAHVSRGDAIQEFVQSADTMVSTAAKSKEKEGWPKQGSKSDHCWKRQSCGQSCSKNRYLIESTTPGVPATISVPALAGKDGQMRKVSLEDAELPAPPSRLGEQASSREHIALGLWSVEPGRKQQASTNRMEEDFQPCSHVPTREDGEFFSSMEESEAAQKVPAEIRSSEQYFTNAFNAVAHDFPVRKAECDKTERREVEDTTATLQNEGNTCSEDLDYPLPHRLPSDIRISWRKFMSAILADPARQSQVEQGTIGIRGQVMNVKHAGNSHTVREGLRASPVASIQDYDSSSKEVTVDTELSMKNHTNDTDPPVKSLENDTDNSITNYINDTHFSRKNYINDTESSSKDHLVGTDQQKTGQTDLLNEQSASRHVHETCFKGGSYQRHGQRHSRHRRLTNAVSGGSITPSRRSATKIRAQRSVDQLVPVPRHPSEVFKCNQEEHHSQTFSTKVKISNTKKIVDSRNESKIGAEDESIMEASSTDNAKDYLKVFRKARRLEEAKSLQETKDTDNNSNKLWDRARSADVLVGERKTFLPSRLKKRVGKRDYSEEGNAYQQHARVRHKLQVSGNQPLQGQQRASLQRHQCAPHDLRRAEHEQSSLENGFSCDKEASTNKLIPGEIRQEAGSRGRSQAGQSGSDFGHKSAQSLCARILRGKLCTSRDGVDYRKWKSGVKDSPQTQLAAEITRKQRWDRICRNEDSESTSLDIQSSKRRGQPEDFNRKEAVSVNKGAAMFRNVCKEQKAANRQRIFPGRSHNCIQRERPTLFRTQFSDGQLQHGSIIPRSQYKVQPPSVHSVKGCQSKCFLLTADSSATSASTTLSSPSPRAGFKMRNAAEHQLKKNRGKRVFRAPVYNIQTKKHKHQSASQLQAAHSAIIAKAKVNAQTHKATTKKQRAVLKALCTKNPSPSCASFTPTHSGRHGKLNVQIKQPPHEIPASLSGCNQSWRNRLDDLNLTHTEGGNLHVASSMCPVQAEIRASQKPYTGFSYLVQDSSDAESRRQVEPSRCYRRSKQHTSIRIKPPKEDSFVGQIVKMFEKKFQFMPSDDSKKQSDDEQSGEM